jgi:hypothetical protein
MPLYTSVTDTGTRLTNDTTLPIFVEGAYRQGAVYEYRTIKTGNTRYPGYFYQHDTGANGEDDFILSADKSVKTIGILEIDFGLIDLVTDAYTVTTDVVPGIKFHRNRGCICQSAAIADPAANTDADTHLTSSSGTAGMVKAVTEATLQSSTGTEHYGFGGTTLGTNTAAGQFILGRVYARTLYFKTTPAADYRDLIYESIG